ncbi:MAG TPA: ATP-binding protein [Candidatus Limnocylindrales bacterium]|nr:ATP-binding protein [Candidatus Limnocylindrales bacterium]
MAPADPPSDAPSPPGSGLHIRVFPARMTALAGLSAFIEEVSGLAGMPRPAGLRLALLLEELFTNTVVHGHRGDSDEPGRLVLGVEPGRIALTYEDTGPPHDPFTEVTRPDDAATVEDRPVGGLGVLLVAALATDVSYSRSGSQNQIRLVIRHP